MQMLLLIQNFMDSLKLSVLELLRRRLFSKKKLNYHLKPKMLLLPTLLDRLLKRRSGTQVRLQRLTAEVRLKGSL